MRKAERDRLAAFLYLLMRDELPVGKINRLLQAVSEGEGDFVASDKTLWVLADSVAVELTEG